MLKIDLMLRGVRLDDDVSGVVPLKGKTGLGVDIVLPRSTLVNVPCDEWFTRDSPYLLTGIDGRYVITDGSAEVAVTIVPPPKFYEQSTTTGVLFSDIAVVHGSYVLITPSSRCDFFDDNLECAYCASGLGGAGGSEESVYTVDEVVETVKAVLTEGTCEIIYLSIGSGSGDDGGVEFLTPYIRAIKKHFNCLVAVEALPPKDNAWIDHTYAAGADSVLYNFEIFDEELFRAICPGRAKMIGRARYVEALAHAVKIFPNGTVASHLIVGLEPPGSTTKGIDFLTQMGVVPILPIYRPSKGKALRLEPLTAEIIIPIYRHLARAVVDNNVNMHWVRDISVVTTPIESRLIEGGKPVGFVRSILENFYKTRLGLKAAWGLSTLRRKLRVREVDTSQGPEK